MNKQIIRYRIGIFRVCLSIVDMSFMDTFFVPEETKVEEGEWEKER